MKKIFYVLIFIIYLKQIFCSVNDISDMRYYLNQFCSYNGKPVYNKTSEKVICECDDKYTDEPREDKKKYINNQLIQCSYRKKKQFTAFFLAAITPFGINFFYLGYYLYFVIIAVINITIITFNCISMVLNYQLEKQNEEAKRQIKLKKTTNKFDIRNLAQLAQLNDKCVKSFNLAAKILIIFMVLFWLSNDVIQALGILNDSNGVPTENDMLYLFQVPDR